MRVYVAGIRIAKEDEDKSLAEKIFRVTALLKIIDVDARRKAKSLGDEDALVFVVLCEYALTPVHAESYDNVNDTLTAFGDAVKEYKNMILIPGSFASVEDLAAYEDAEGIERRRSESEVLLRNYETITSNPDLSSRVMVVKARNDLNAKLKREPDISQYLFLRNAASVLTPQSKVTRNKSIPYFEYKRTPYQEHNSIFVIGSINPIVKVRTHTSELNLGLLICFEQLALTLPAGTTQNEVPLFQVVVSNTVVMNHDNLFAAVTIQMDGRTGLNGLKVVVNYNHCHADKVDHIECYVYDSDNLQHRTEQVGIMAISGKKFSVEELAAIPAPTPLPATAGHKLFRVQRNPDKRFNLHQHVWPRRQQDDDDENPGAKLNRTSINNSNN